MQQMWYSSLRFGATSIPWLTVRRRTSTTYLAHNDARARMRDRPSLVPCQIRKYLRIHPMPVVQCPIGL